MNARSLWPAQSRTLLVLPAHLHVKAVRILDVETARRVTHLQPPALQLNSDCIPNLFVRVPVGDRVGDVIDARCIGRPATGVAGNDERIANGEPALPSVVLGNLHPE